MIRLLWTLSVHVRYYLRRYAPSNIAIDAIRTRDGLKWGIPAMLLAMPYLLAVQFCTNALVGGGPGWLNLIVLVAGYNALKFVLVGPSSVVLLVRARAEEMVARRGVFLSCQVLVLGGFLGLGGSTPLGSVCRNLPMSRVPAASFGRRGTPPLTWVGSDIIGRSGVDGCLASGVV